MFWQVGAFGNIVLLVVVMISVMAQLAIHRVHFTERLVGVCGLSPAACGVALLIGFVPVTVIELAKLLPVKRQWRRRHLSDGQDSSSPSARTTATSERGAS